MFMLKFIDFHSRGIGLCFTQVSIVQNTGFKLLYMLNLFTH